MIISISTKDLKDSYEISITDTHFTEIYNYKSSRLVSQELAIIATYSKRKQNIARKIAFYYLKYVSWYSSNGKRAINLASLQKWASLISQHFPEYQSKIFPCVLNHLKRFNVFPHE